MMILVNPHPPHWTYFKTSPNMQIIYWSEEEKNLKPVHVQRESERENIIHGVIQALEGIARQWLHE